jgi:glycosyltransferase involved in cell wall biosynthesis
MKTICHITTGLNIGGAEMFLLNLASALKPHGYRQTIISLLGEGDLSDKVINEHIDLIHLAINRYPWTWWRIFKLPILLRRLSPDIVQTWLYHADLIGGFASIFIRTKLVWNVRQTDISLKNNKREIVLVARVGAALSKYLPQKIICCSESAKDSHVNIGYQSEKFVVIPNGCDTSVYCPDTEKRKLIREILNISEKDFVIGRFGRFDPQKDYKNFISAADDIQSSNENTWFLMVGENITHENTELKKWINGCRAPEKFILLGKRTDLPDLYQAVDIMVSSSLGEGFPNVVAEAMACEVPCVVTDVGESGRLIGDTGRIVPKKDMKRLSLACQELIDVGNIERQRLGAAARMRIVNSYSIERSVVDYRELYDGISA